MQQRLQTRWWGKSGGKAGACSDPFFSSHWTLNVISIFCFFLLWDFLAAYKILGNSLARPHEVVQEIVRLCNYRLAGLSLAGHIWASFSRVLIGWSIASLVAVPLGLFMALHDTTRAVVKPLFDLIKPMPPIAWISIAILWMGIGETSKVFIIMVGTFVPCLLNAYNGVRLVDPQLYDVIRSQGGNRRDEIFQICFPASAGIFAGLQISLSLAWMCVLAAELVSARSGLGFLNHKRHELQQTCSDSDGHGRHSYGCLFDIPGHVVSGEFTLSLEARCLRDLTIYFIS